MINPKIEVHAMVNCSFNKGKKRTTSLHVSLNTKFAIWRISTVPDMIVVKWKLSKRKCYKIEVCEYNPP